MFNEFVKNVMNLGIITASDVERLTANELMLLIIERTNGLLEEVNRIDLKYDQITDSLTARLDGQEEFIVNNLDDYTVAVFNKWLNDGTFDKLINKMALSTVNERIDETNLQMEINQSALQNQIDSLVLESGGGSDLEVTQARTSLDGTTYQTLNSRLNMVEKAIKTNKAPISVEFEQGSINLTNGATIGATNTIRTKEFCNFGKKVVVITLGEGYKIRPVGYDSSNHFLWYGNWSEGTVIVEADKDVRYKFIVSKTDDSTIEPSASTNVVFEYEYGVVCPIEDEIKEEIAKKADMPTHYAKQELDLTLDKVHGTNGVNYDQWGGAYGFYDCLPNQVIRVTGYGQSPVYPVLIFYNKEGNYQGTYGDVNTGYTDHEVTIPEGCYKVCLNAKDANTMKLEAQVPYSSFDDYLNERTANDDEMAFEIENIYHRIMRNEKQNEFAWKPVDKTYFAFVMDDCTPALPSMQELFAELQVPLSIGCVVNTLETTYVTSSGSSTVKQILDKVVANGGEIMAHYTGSPNDSSSDAEWLKVTREVKKVLTQNGFEVRGLIRADSTPNGTNKGEKYCRLYFDYSDGVGYSTQYNIRRWFLMGTTELSGMKAYIDQCRTKAGFYPIAFHGNRDDEPMATPEHMREVINYIKSLGDDVAIITYREFYDRFATTELENRLKALENK